MNPLTTIAFSAVTFLIGLFVGNRLAISRDRRKERNTAFEPIRARLIEWRSYRIRRCPELTEPEIDLLYSMLPRWKHRSFREAVAQYNDARKQSMERGSLGGVVYPCTTEQIDATNLLLRKYIKRY